MMKFFSIAVFIPLIAMLMGPAFDHHFLERNGLHSHAHQELNHTSHTHEFEHSHSHSTSHTLKYASSVTAPMLSINQAANDSLTTDQTNGNLSYKSGEGTGNFSSDPVFSQTYTVSDQSLSTIKNPPRLNA